MSLKPGTLLEVDQTLMQVVKNALDKWGVDPQEINQKKRRTSLDGRGGGESQYNGYFTIKAVLNRNGIPEQIIVCDGMTYNSENGTSDDSVANFNGTNYRVKFWNNPVREGDYVLVIILNLGLDTAQIYALKKGEESKLPVPYYIIGDYSKQGSDFSFNQRHTGDGNGVAEIEWSRYLGYFTISAWFEIAPEGIINFIQCFIGNGLDFDWESGISSDSIAQVNDKYFKVPYACFKEEQERKKVIVEYDVDLDDVEIKIVDPVDDIQTPHAVIGYIQESIYGGPILSQHHGNAGSYYTDGRAYIPYYLRCEDIVRKEKEDDKDKEEDDDDETPADTSGS